MAPPAGSAPYADPASQSMMPLPYPMPMSFSSFPDMLSPASAPPMSPHMRKIWVRRLHGSATLITAMEADLVDDARDAILRKYTNSLGRTADAPDIVLRIVPRPVKDSDGPALLSRPLEPEEMICRVLDWYFPDGQLITDALVIELVEEQAGQPQRSQPTSGSPGDVLGTRLHRRPLDSANEYFPHMPAYPLGPVNVPPAAGHPSGHSSPAVTPDPAFPDSGSSGFAVPGSLQSQSPAYSQLDGSYFRHGSVGTPGAHSGAGTGTSADPDGLFGHPSPAMLGSTSPGDGWRPDRPGLHRQTTAKSNSSHEAVMPSRPPLRQNKSFPSPGATSQEDRPADSTGAPPSVTASASTSTSTTTPSREVPPGLASTVMTGTRPEAAHGKPSWAGKPANGDDQPGPDDDGDDTIDNIDLTNPLPLPAPKKFPPTRLVRPAPMPMPVEPTVPPISVLIVEDNAISLRVLSQFARRLKLRFDSAVNGREAVTKWRQGGFHLVLMDIQLPMMSGIEVTKEIRRLERANGIGVFPHGGAGSDHSRAPSRARPVDLASSGRSQLGSARGSGTGRQKGPSLEQAWQASEVGPRFDPGEEVAEADQLQNMDLFKSPVIIVALTASNLHSDRREALMAGCNDYLIKPVNLHLLERKVKEWGFMQALIDYEGWRGWLETGRPDDAAEKPAEKPEGQVESRADDAGTTTTTDPAEPAGPTAECAVPDLGPIAEPGEECVQTATTDLDGCGSEPGGIALHDQSQQDGQPVPIISPDEPAVDIPTRPFSLDVGLLADSLGRAEPDRLDMYVNSPVYSPAGAIAPPLPNPITTMPQSIATAPEGISMMVSHSDPIPSSGPYGSPAAVPASVGFGNPALPVPTSGPYGSPMSVPGSATRFGFPHHSSATFAHPAATSHPRYSFSSPHLSRSGSSPRLGPVGGVAGLPHALSHSPSPIDSVHRHLVGFSSAPSPHSPLSPLGQTVGMEPEIGMIGHLVGGPSSAVSEGSFEPHHIDGPQVGIGPDWPHRRHKSRLRLSSLPPRERSGNGGGGRSTMTGQNVGAGQHSHHPSHSQTTHSRRRHHSHQGHGQTQPGYGPGQTTGHTHSHSYSHGQNHGPVNYPAGSSHGQSTTSSTRLQPSRPNRQNTGSQMSRRSGPTKNSSQQQSKTENQRLETTCPPPVPDQVADPDPGYDPDEDVSGP